MLWMKIFLLALFSFSSAAAVAQPLESVSLTRLNKKKMKIKNNKPVVLQFWASWCVSCGETMQKINKATKKKSVKFYGISLDEEMGSIKGYIKSKPYLKSFKRKIVWDRSSQLAEKLNVGAVPSIIIYDRNGKEVFRKEGKPDNNDMKKMKKILRKVS